MVHVLLRFPHVRMFTAHLLLSLQLGSANFRLPSTYPFFTSNFGHVMCILFAPALVQFSHLPEPPCWLSMLILTRHFKIFYVL